jgi:hypothetical protein
MHFPITSVLVKLVFTVGVNMLVTAWLDSITHPLQVTSTPRNLIP